MFRRQELIRFQHCDPAGIVFYPRYVEMLNATVEDWFAEVVGTSFAEIHVMKRTAIPVVSLSIDFRQVSRLGEILNFTLAVDRIGKTSASLLIKAESNDEVRLDARLTLVHIGLDDYRPRVWPDKLRIAMEN
ncbi:acyl-CoA thioesterase (plasmid) [Rhizobium sp. RCAM05350]|uniref:acyl-CoA thioesterase n=1 Tax=Rhizobium sp. RCAM05350 TaxID=2895568 RepID=UPI0020768F04|nr:thioesterase family protein [Rhizobium sp. RCAM05350]URK89407.1 acyl-CoA thioesterase [Rhizobium sp. RCAM05350]